MRTVTNNVYRFEELSEEVQDRIIERNRTEVGNTLCSFDNDEYRGTLEMIEKVFSISLSATFSYSAYNFRFTSTRWDFVADDPRYLVRYLNKVEESCRSNRTYWSKHPRTNGFKKRVSRIFSELEWSLTGTWCDDAVIECMKCRWDAVKMHRTIREFVDDLVGDFLASWTSNNESNYEDDAIRDVIVNRDEEYLEDGTVYNL